MEKYTTQITGVEIKLTKEQQKHLKTIEWLLDFNINRASGRSYLLAIGFIKMALKYPNRWIEVFDHFPNLYGRDRLLLTIRQIISADKELLKKIDFQQGRFRINYY